MRVRVRHVRRKKRFSVGVDEKRNALHVARSESRTVPNVSSSRTMVLNRYGWGAMDVVIHANGTTFYFLHQS